MRDAYFSKHLNYSTTQFYLYLDFITKNYKKIFKVREMEKGAIEITHSKGSMVSWGFGKFINEFFKMAFGTYVFYFYEREIGLDVVWTMLGFIIYAIWNAFNDPLLGYLTDRPFKFTKKWGRRFPWVLIGGIPWILSYVFVFTPPSVDPNSLQGAFILFLWIVIMTCVFDAFASLFIVNYYAIFTDKFRGDSERRLASTLGTMVGALGTGLGAIIPSMLVTYGDKSSYIIQGAVVSIVCSIALVLLVPGSREDQERIDCYLDKCEEGIEKESFFKELTTTLKHKNFYHYTIAYTCYMSLVSLMVGSIPYTTEFILGKEADDTIFIMAAMLFGMIFGMPIWGKIAEKTDDDRKTMLIASAFLTVATIPLIFLNNYLLILITMFIWGLCQGGYWVQMGPILSQVIDESIVMTGGKRNEGIYNGVQNFIGRLALVVQAVSFAVVHTLTGFVEGGDLAVQPPAAIVGIQIHFALIPFILMVIATAWFWKFYTLTPDKVKKNTEKIIQIEM